MSDLKSRQRWTIGVAAAVLLVGWGLFHPKLRPDVNTIPRSVREALAHTGFRQTQGITATKLETSESGVGFSENWTVDQTIVPIDELITEKWTRRRTHGTAEESTGLYVGPFAVVRLSRTWPPLIGNLLPYQFWASSNMSAFVLEETSGFPDTKGGIMRARVTYEDRYAGGELAQIENRQLQCQVADVVEAASINSRLSGRAARIDCREELVPGGRVVGDSRSKSHLAETASYSHWYVFRRGWSIPLEGERTIRFGEDKAVLKWSTRLVSFEPST